MGVTCQILLQRPKEGFYRPAQAIMGTVKYNVDNKTEFESINISLIGKGKVHWEEKSNNSTTHYYGKEDYILQHNIIQETVRNGTVIYEEGNYEHPFHFILPETIPSTFKNYVGNISYKVVLKFERPRTFNRYKIFETEVPVRAYVNRIHPEPVICGLKKNLMISNKSVSLKAEVDKTVIIPGDEVNVTITINTESNVHIKSIKTELYRHTYYVSDGGRKNLQLEYFKDTIKESPSMDVNGEVKLSCVIPTLSNLYSIQNSKIVIGDYKIKITVRLPFPHINDFVDVPVVLGEQKETDSFPYELPDDGQLISVWEKMVQKKMDDTTK